MGKRLLGSAAAVPAFFQQTLLSSQGYPIPDGPTKVAHPTPMLSLDSVASRDEADAWATRTLARLARSGIDVSSTSWTAEPKVDGLALRLSYKAGKLVQAATRGDGVAGEDVTAVVAARVDGVPATLPGTPIDVEIRGEAYMTHAEFEAANAAAEQAGLTPFSNPRNLAAATLRAGATTATSHTPAAEAAAKRRLSFAAYGLILQPGTEGAPATHAESLAWLQKRGVSVADPLFVRPTLQAALDAAAAWMDTRATLPYDVDGSVIKADALAVQAALGAGPTAPRWAVAWKFPAADAVTTLAGVTWQLGRTGALVPVAELTPVTVGGVVVARASLHNLSVARRLGARIGDAVVVRRAGDVVPQVVAAVPSMRTGSETEWRVPSECPACGGELTRDATADTETLRCESRSCPGRSLKRVQHFAACVASDGVGPATVAAIVDGGAAADAADLVALTANDLQHLPRFGELRAAAVAAALNAAYTAPPAAVLAGLAIPGVGRAVADALLTEFKSIQALADAAARGGLDLTPVPRVGPAIAAALETWFAVDDNVALVERLLEAGVGTGVVETPQQPASDAPLAGASILVTGTVPGLSRAAAHAAITAAGGTPVAAVSSKTAAVVVGDAPGAAKLDKASALGVPVVPAALFFEGGMVVWRPDS